MAPPLGRPVPDDLAAIRKQTLADTKVRNQIEGKFGQAKRRFSLDRVMTKLANTSETAIAITFLMINSEALLRQLVFNFFLELCLPEYVLHKALFSSICKGGLYLFCSLLATFSLDCQEVFSFSLS